MCAVSMLVGAPRNRSRFDCRYGFHEDVLDSAYVPILLYCCTRIQYVTLAIILSDLGERMHRDKILPQRMQRFAEFNGSSYESYCSLEQLVASISAADERKSAACTYHRVCIIRRQKTTTPEDTCTNHPVCCIVGSALGLE